jgi:hypothetical protein
MPMAYTPSASGRSKALFSVFAARFSNPISEKVDDVIKLLNAITDLGEIDNTQVDDVTRAAGGLFERVKSVDNAITRLVAITNLGVFTVHRSGAGVAGSPSWRRVDAAINAL